VTPASLHALGFSWLASGTLDEALLRFCRYHRVITTLAVDPRTHAIPDGVTLELHYHGTGPRPWPQGVEATLMGVLTLCRLVTTPAFRPLAVSFTHAAPCDPARYSHAFGARLSFDAALDSMTFAADELKLPLRGQNPEVARATDRVAEQYLEGLDPARVTSTVRGLLLRLLEDGTVSQAAVATELHRSASTLQRQLQSEGTTFRALLDETRCALAERYLRAGEYSHAEIAYKLGFTDQSNFSRAFRRWRGVSPRAFQRLGTSGSPVTGPGAGA
jgi:AraC-like DNA-binding protein